MYRQLTSVRSSYALLRRVQTAQHSLHRQCLSSTNGLLLGGNIGAKFSSQNELKFKPVEVLNIIARHISFSPGNGRLLGGNIGVLSGAKFRAQNEIKFNPVEGLNVPLARHIRLFGPPPVVKEDAENDVLETRTPPRPPKEPEIKTIDMSELYVGGVTREDMPEKITVSEEEVYDFEKNLWLLKYNYVLEDTAPILPSEMLTELSQGDVELGNKLKLIELEMEVARQEGCRVPVHMCKKDWQEILVLPSKHKRLSFANYLFVRHIKKVNSKLKQLEKRKYMEAWRGTYEGYRRAQLTSDPIRYGLFQNCIFNRIDDNQMDRFFNHRMVQRGLLFGQPVVVDCSFDQHMTTMEINNCAKQLQFLVSVNRTNQTPFKLIFCNVNKDAPTMQTYAKAVPTFYQHNYPVIAEPRHYLDIFPKNKLVYLTPHCNEDLLEFDTEAVYILGAIVDKSHSIPLTLAKAKKEGLKMARFPLNKFIVWGAGARKSLVLHHCLQLMLDVRDHGDWTRALEDTIPQRKLRPNDFPPEKSLYYQPKRIERDDEYGQVNVARHRYDRNSQSRSRDTVHKKRVSIRDHPGNWWEE